MNKDGISRRAEVCAYKNCCYLAEALECFGYKTDCVLYRKSNNAYYSRQSFDTAVDQLINKTKARHELLHPDPSGPIEG